MDVVGKYLPRIKSGRDAEDILRDYLRAILRRAGYDPNSEYSLNGNTLRILKSATDNHS